MAALGDDKVSQLKSAVDSWAAEVAAIRSSLTSPAKPIARRPSLRLQHERRAFTPTAPVAAPASAPAVTIGEPKPSRASDNSIELARLQQELEFAREQLMATAQAANDARALADEKSEQMEELARALGRARLDLNEAQELIRAKEWALLQSDTENSTLRGDEKLVRQARVVASDDYDALVESHLSLRAEIESLQEGLIRRDHELMAVRTELDAARAELHSWESVSPVSGAGIARMAGVIAERSAALEQIETTAQGQDLLIAALRQELAAVREALDRKDVDHSRLAMALRGEIEALRAVSSERDFVIGHQAQSIEVSTMQENELRAQLETARAECEALRARAQQAAEETEKVGRELHLIRAKLAERETEVWKLRTAGPAPMSSEPGLAQLQAALAARDNELSQARERINFLRNQVRQTNGVAAMAEVLTPDPFAAAPATAPANAAPALPPMELKQIQENFRVQREVEADLATEFPWYMVGIIGGIAGVGLLILGLMALFMAR